MIHAGENKSGNSDYDEFLSYLMNEDRERCVRFALSRLGNNTLDIVTLYRDYIERAIRERNCKTENCTLCVWEEHVWTSILRTVIECCFPYVINERRRNYGERSKGKVLVVCPDEEYRELGARMITDYFLLKAYDAIYVGANTPREAVVEAINHLSPVFVAISVTGFYNLVASKRTIQCVLDIRAETGASFKVIAGGRALQRNPGVFKGLDIDYVINSWEDLGKLEGL